VKTNGLRMQRAPNLEHMSKYTVKEHCVYCDKALYTMKFNMATQVVTVQDDADHYHNSDGKRICKPCSDRLIRRGAVIECSCCDKPLYEFRHDKFKEDDLKLSEIKGIHPQHDPIEEVVNRCVHCSAEIIWG
jgi:hypothetical protein